MKYYLSLIVLAVLAGCNFKPDLIKNQQVGEALGTTYSIIFIADEELNLQNEIDSVFHLINKSMSTYLPDSDISKINRGDTTIVVDKMFREVFEISSTVYHRSDGYFDPTVGVLVNAWGFGPEDSIELDSTSVDSLLHYVGWNKVNLDVNGIIKKSNPEIRFDFNAVAKGYAIDRLGKMLEGKGLENFLVEVGGEVLAKGSNTISNKMWTVGIDDPTNLDNRGAAARVVLKNKALASSGNYRKFRIDPKTGEKFVHTIDPKTGFTKNSKVLAATVIADDCATADAYATAFMAMNFAKSKKLLNQHKELEAFIIYVNDKGEPQKYMTSGFQSLIKN